MRLIDRSFDKLCDARNAATCYTTLCRIANLKGRDAFEISIASLARDLHCVYRDAQKALALVAAIKLVKIERRKIPGTKENAPSFYTITRIRPDIMSAPTDNTSEGLGRDRVHDPSRTLPKNSPNNAPSTSPNTVAGSLSGESSPAAPARKTRKLRIVEAGDIQRLKADSFYAKVNIDHEYQQLLKWCEREGKHPSLKRFERWIAKEARRAARVTVSSKAPDRTYAPVEASWKTK